MESGQIIQVIAALLFVLALFGLLALLLRRFNQLQGQKEGSRLKVLETRILDSKRRMVLVKRDKQEHLLLLGPDRETLIESWEAEDA